MNNIRLCRLCMFFDSSHESVKFLYRDTPTTSSDERHWSQLSRGSGSSRLLRHRLGYSLFLFMGSATSLTLKILVTLGSTLIVFRIMFNFTPC